MKYLCTKADKNSIELQGDCSDIKEGNYYSLEDITAGTSPQNRFFHPLVQEFWNWMHKTDTWKFELGEVAIDLSTPDWCGLKDLIKYRYGKGIEYYFYSDEKGAIKKVKALCDIPDSIIQEFRSTNPEKISGVHFSWRDYTKKDRKNLIDHLIRLMETAQVDTKKFYQMVGELGKWKQKDLYSKD